MISNKGFIHLAFAAVALVVICLQPAQATTGKAQIATITMKDSTVYELVSIRINHEKKILYIETEDKEQKLNFADVVSVVGDSGHDITGEIIGRSNTADTEKWLSKDSPTYKKLRIRPGRFRLNRERYDSIF